MPDPITELQIAVAAASARDALSAITVTESASPKLSVRLVLLELVAMPMGQSSLPKQSPTLPERETSPERIDTIIGSSVNAAISPPFLSLIHI